MAGSLASTFEAAVSVSPENFDEPRNDNLEVIQGQVRDLAEEVGRLNRQFENVDGLAQMGFEAATLVHDLSNIIGGMMGYVQLAQMTGEQEDIQKCLQVIGTGMQRGRQLIASFKTAISNRRSFETISVRDAIESALKCLSSDLEREGISTRLIGRDHFVIADPRILRKVLLISLTSVALNLPARSALEISIAQMNGELAVCLLGDFEDAIATNPTEVRSRRTYPMRPAEQQFLNGLLAELGGRSDGESANPRSPSIRFILPT
jgi:light-regulated signal transduction histidine kinase (bacteriophytochrome)